MDRNGGARSAPILLVFAVTRARLLCVIGIHSDHWPRTDIGGASKYRVQTASVKVLMTHAAMRRGMGGGAGIAARTGESAVT